MDVSQGCHHSLMLFTHKLSFLSKLQGLSWLASAVIQTVDDKDKQGRSWKKAGRERVSGCMCLSYREAEICGHEGVRKERRIHRSMKRWMTGEDKPCFPKQITAWSASIFHILKTCSLANWFKLCSKPLFSCKKNLVSFRVIFLFFYEIHVLLKLDFWNLKPKNMHGGCFSFCTWKVHIWEMQEWWTPIYHFLSFWKRFHTACVVLTWFFVHWLLSFVHELCACTICSHPLYAFTRVQYVCSCVLCMPESVCVCVWRGWVCLASCLEGKPDPMWPCVSPAAHGSEQPGLSARRPAGRAQTLFTLLFLVFFFQDYYCW